MNSESTNWTELNEFKAIDITKSYILSWSTESESLLIDIDLYLHPDHPSYEKPRPSEKACFRPALIEFPWCTDVDTDLGDRSLTVSETANTISPGRISGFRKIGEGRYNIIGEFGLVNIFAERPMVRLKNQQAGNKRWS